MSINPLAEVDELQRSGDRFLAIVTAIHGVAVLSTIFRLARRIQIRRISWDDAWAALAALLGMGFVVTTWLAWNRTIANVKESLKQSTSLPLPKFGAVELIMVAFNVSAIWSARISLSLSISRIVPPGRLQTVASRCAIACFAVGSALLVYEVTMLSIDKIGWNSGRISDRPTTMLISGPQVADILFSLVLVGLPLYALSKMTALPSSERRMLLVLFAGTLLTLACGCALAVFLILGSQWGAMFSIHLQADIGLMVCNSLVVVTVMYKAISWSRLGRIACSWGRGRAQTRAEVAQPEDSANSSNAKNTVDVDYNAGERGVGVSGASVQYSTSSRFMDSAAAESQFTDIQGVQTCSYMLESIHERRDLDPDPKVAA